MEITMKTLIAAGLSALTLAACASSPTPKAAGNVWSEGYTQYALSGNRYLIEYRMAGSDYQRAYDLALWRAAQLTQEHGYQAFEVVNRESATDPGARASTSFTAQRGVAYQRSCGLLSCTTTATPVTWNTLQAGSAGRQPSRVVSLEVMLTNDPVSGSPNRYLAAEIIGDLQER
jgi:hypothetical protein